MKYDYELKLQICREMEETGTGYRAISRKYPISQTDIQYMYSFHERHGPDILKHGHAHWTKSQKETAVKRVLNGESIKSVSIDIGLPKPSALSRWVKEHKGNEYAIVERKRGKPPMNKASAKKKENLTQEEYLKRLEQENLELRIENEHLRKLDALVQKRKAQQRKRKSQQLMSQGFDIL